MRELYHCTLQSASHSCMSCCARACSSLLLVNAHGPHFSATGGHLQLLLKCRP